MAELVDALRSGRSKGNLVEVQILFPAQNKILCGNLKTLSISLGAKRVRYEKCTEYVRFKSSSQHKKSQLVPALYTYGLFVHIKKQL